ncbi:hypothetical protein NADFUDRAFT_83274 [Nadsonia fulvescens var. elongata DSM 6958]|uniref:Altered inheritance of mitochondria protein 24, mitochondrial n=1 Tax=Nadsonia fulvescens var. elongata DSM 6958 TaxID=857566 RepID=A0A1E3PIJ4_9ASCO|nr:hypothetical protein NADFUDRAFT_83274 [Nadsonia fulvescens var. elongata DSM 6958]
MLSTQKYSGLFRHVSLRAPAAFSPVVNSLLAARARSLHTLENQASANPDAVSNALQDLPQVSGAGPFPLTPRFEVLGNPATLINVSLPASSVLYTRRGSIIGINGQIENVSSSLSSNQAFTRATQRIPFLYHKISSTTPASVLVSSQTPHLSTFAVISLDGTQDWTIAQRKALVAWSGAALRIEPNTPSLRSNRASFPKWGTTGVYGRGEVALVGNGHVYRIELQQDEEILVHPTNLIALSSPSNDVEPGTGLTSNFLYRLKSKVFKSQYNNFSSATSSQAEAKSDNTIPAVTKLVPGKVRFELPSLPFLERFRGPGGIIEKFTQTEIYAGFRKASNWIKGRARRLLWGDDVYYRIHGPRTLLIQTSGSSMREIVSRSELAKFYQSNTLKE